MSSPALTAVYPGTFDPITMGHIDLLRRASAMFSRVVLAVAVAHHKKTMFSLEERMGMAKEVVRDLPNVEVIEFSGLLRDFVVAQGGKVLVRGVRSVTDFDYEYQMAGMNRHLMPEVETVFLMPAQAYQFVSSTYVREIAMLGGDVTQFVAPHVLACLQKRLAPVS